MPVKLILHDSVEVQNSSKNCGQRDGQTDRETDRLRGRQNCLLAIGGGHWSLWSVWLSSAARISRWRCVFTARACAENAFVLRKTQASSAPRYRSPASVCFSVNWPKTRFEFRKQITAFYSRARGCICCMCAALCSAVQCSAVWCISICVSATYPHYICSYIYASQLVISVEFRVVVAFFFCLYVFRFCVSLKNSHRVCVCVCLPPVRLNLSVVITSTTRHAIPADTRQLTNRATRRQPVIQTQSTCPSN